MSSTRTKPADGYLSLPLAACMAVLAIAGVRIEHVVDYEIAFARFGPQLLEAVAE